MTCASRRSEKSANIPRPVEALPPNSARGGKTIGGIHGFIIGVPTPIRGYRSTLYLDVLDVNGQPLTILYVEKTIKIRRKNI